MNLNKFIGREPELQSIQEMLDVGYGLIGFYGLGGVGKTTLLQIIEKNCHKKGIFTIWVNGDEFINTIDLTDSILRQTEKLNNQEVDLLHSNYRQNLSNLVVKVDINNSEIGVVKTGAFSRTGDIAIYTNLSIENELFKQRKELALGVIHKVTNIIQSNNFPLVFFFDVLEWVQDSVWADLVIFIKLLSKESVVICAGRKFDTQVANQLLEELSSGEAIQLLSNYGVSETFQSAIANHTRIPFCLELGARYSFLSNASPLAFSIQNAKDNASLITEYIRKLILERLKAMAKLLPEDKEIQAVTDILEYGCVFTELTPTLLLNVLGKIEPFAKNFKDRVFVNKVLDNGLLKAHIVSTFPPRFHDLISELAPLALKREQPDMYIIINLKAAEYYASQLIIEDDSERLRQLLDGTLAIELTPAHLHDKNYSEWRQNFTKFNIHLSKAKPQTGFDLIKQVFAKVFYPHYEPFCEQLLQAIDENSISTNDRAWLLTKKVYAGLKEPEATLAEILNYGPNELTPDIWTEASTRLLYSYIANAKASQAKELLEKIKRSGQFFTADESTEIYLRLARTFWKSAHYHQAFQTYQEALLIATNERTQAQIKLDMVVNLRYLNDYENAIKLANELLPLWNKLNQPDKLSETYIALGDVYRFADKWHNARLSYQEAIQTLEAYPQNKEQSESTRDQGQRFSLLGTAYGALGRYYLKIRNLDYARELLEKGINILDRGGNPYHHYGWMKRLLAHVFELSHDHTSALRLHHEALSASERAGDLGHQIENMICVLNIYKELKNEVALQDAQNKLSNLLKRTEVHLDRWISKVSNDLSPLINQDNNSIT